jgi:hypothetical protein
MENTTRLSEIEWTCLWMAIRYAMNRQTIASATLPNDIITNYYHRLSDSQKKSIVKDLKGNEGGFGNPQIDKPGWMKFWAALDEINHYEVELIDNTKCTVFEADGKIIPLHKYIDEPYNNHFLPVENVRRQS